MKKNKIILIIAAIIILLGVVLLGILRSNSLRIKPYSKYEMSILINTFKDDQNETISIRLKSDGENSRISSNKVEYDAFKIGDQLQYLKEQKIYTYVPESFYDHLNEIFSDIKKADKLSQKEEYTNYSAVLSAKEVNRILTALCFDLKISDSILVKFSLVDSHVKSLNMSLAYIGEYSKVDVMINFDELDEDYEVDTSKLYNPHKLYKYEETNENIFAIIR